MKLKFAIITWLIAVFLNAIFSAIYLSGDSMLLELAEWWGIFIMVLIVSGFFSLPGFAGIFLWIWVADNFYFSSGAKFICFTIGCLLTTFLCYGVLFFTLGHGHSETRIIYLVLMSLFAVTLALLLQRKYFFRIVTTFE